MLARSEKLYLPNGDFIETPILLPSFSSRGFPELKKITKYLEEHLSGPFLISAYDLHHKLIQRKLKFANRLVFIDSGGYESASITDFLDADKGTYRPKKWNVRSYQQEINASLKDSIPKVIISYDHPKVRKPINEQITSAKLAFNKFSSHGHKFIKEILIKPEAKEKNEQSINIENVIQQIKKFESFDIIGFTETEMGKSLLERMNNIHRFRSALSENNMKQLLHIFGALDTISTPLYFICGADIFDGLTWLRYAYDNGLTTYQRNYWAKYLPGNMADIYLRQATFEKNFHYLQQLTLQMKRFLKTHEFKEFAPNGNIINDLWNSLG